MWSVDTGAMRVLVIEDDPHMAALLQRGLTEEGALVALAPTARDGIRQAEDAHYDVIVLDLMLPDASGVHVCRRLRAERIWTPVVMLTARDAVTDRVAGLDAGADDYLVKPFAFDELLARLRALLRRGRAERPVVLRAGPITLDPASRRVWHGAAEVRLTVKEFAVLTTLMSSPDQVLTRAQLLDHAWDVAYEERSNVVDVCMRSLREKLDRPFGTTLVQTVRGVGYRIAGLRQ
jgi:two-component system OmpR family response regulator